MCIFVVVLISIICPTEYDHELSQNDCDHVLLITIIMRKFMVMSVLPGYFQVKMFTMY